MLTNDQAALISSHIQDAQVKMSALVREQTALIASNLSKNLDPYTGVPDNYVLNSLIQITIEACVDAVISQVKVQSGITVVSGATNEVGDLILE